MNKVNKNMYAYIFDLRCNNSRTPHAQPPSLEAFVHTKCQAIHTNRQNAKKIDEENEQKYNMHDCGS